MADSTHGRLFDLGDLQRVLDCSKLDGMESASAADIIEHMEEFGIAPAFTIPADEPLWLQRASRNAKEDGQTFSEYLRASEEWRAANPDRVKVSDA
jgi:hypothetical protein